MDAFFTSTLAVALAEIGDKTQLLSLLLITRFRQPTPIILAILIATIANHALAGLLGAAVGSWLGPELLRWIVGLGFLAMAAWTLIPDKLDEDQKAPTRGAFITSLIAFFLAEMGDKTQLATIGLAAAHNVVPNKAVNLLARLLLVSSRSVNSLVIRRRSSPAPPSA